MGSSLGAPFPFGTETGPFQSVVFTPNDGFAPLRVDSITFGAAVIPEPSMALLTTVGLILAALCVSLREAGQIRI